MSSNAYAAAGVDVDIEAQASRIMYEASRKSFANRTGRIGEIITPFDDFAGLKCIEVSALPIGSCLSLGFDGAGTKVEFVQRVRDYRTIAHDLFAMVCDDAVVRGGEPVLVGSVLDITSLGKDERYLPIIQEMADGCVAAARAANVAIINGEIAQMGTCVSGFGEFPFNWSAGCVWFAQKERLLTGREAKPGDAIVLLREKGLRANGISLVREAFGDAFGGMWHMKDFYGSTLGAHVVVPSTIYSRLVVRLNGGFENDAVARLHGVIHITGGGIPEKFGRFLRPSGLGAHLSDLWDPPQVLISCQEAGEIEDRDAYGTWCMGQGMAIVTPDPDIVLCEAQAIGIDAKVGGAITTQPGVSIISRGRYQQGQRLDL